MSQHQEEQTILVVEGLHKTYSTNSHKKRAEIKALQDVSFSLYRGETLGIVGESGCGKSTLGKTILRLVEPTSGSAWFEGVDLFQATGAQMRELRQHMQIIFQDPYASLNPRMTIGNIVAEPLEILGGMTAQERKERVMSLLETVGLDLSCYNRFPSEFSGGQRQRVCIARALALEPRLIVCDEPVSALDVSIQSQILNLLRRLQKERSLTYLFISHDLSVIRHISDRICVMYLGRIVEMGPAQEVYNHPLHPYTQGLLSDVLSPVPNQQGNHFATVAGEASVASAQGEGCPFRSRCPKATERCGKERPAAVDLDGHTVCCHLYTPADASEDVSATNCSDSVRDTKEQGILC